MQDVTKRIGAADPHRLDALRTSVLRRTGDILLRWREASILLACVLLAAYFQSTNSTFLSVSNIQNLIDFTATTAIIAAGEVMVLVCGELDLSVGGWFMRSSPSSCISWLRTGCRKARRLPLRWRRPA